MKKRWLSACSVVGMMACSNAWAAKSFDLSLGLAAGSAPQYIGSDRQELYIFPIFDAAYHLNKNLKIFAGPVDGLGLEYAAGKVAGGLGVSYRYGLYGAEDLGLLQDKPDELDGMSDPGDTVTVKSYVKTLNRVWNAKLEVEQGLESTNDGWSGKLFLSRNYYVSETLFGKTGLKAAFGDEQFSNDYFGISEGEVRPDRQVFAAESGVYAYGLWGEINYMINPKNLFVASAGAMNFNNDVKESDIIQEDLQLEFIFGYVHIF